MSYVAQCEQCGTIETGDLEDVGDAVDDHDQFHDVQIQRTATDGGRDLSAPEAGYPYDTLSELADAGEDRFLEHVDEHGTGANWEGYAPSWFAWKAVRNLSTAFPDDESVDMDQAGDALNYLLFAVAAARYDDARTDGGGHECDACGDTFATLSRLRLHEKDDCPERQRFADLDPSDSDVGLQAAGEALTCRGCGAEHSDIDFEETPSFADGDYHLIIEFVCPSCGFDNENRVVLEGVDRENLDQLPPHLQPDDNELATDGGRDDDGAFFVVDEANATVLSGPFDTKDNATDDVEDRTGQLMIATRTVLQMLELASTSSLTWGPDAEKPVPDGGGDVTTWRLECMDCDYTEDVDVTDADETPPRTVEREVTRHKTQSDASHVVRVHQRPDQKDIDPSLLTDGGRP